MVSRGDKPHSHWKWFLPTYRWETTESEQYLVTMGLKTCWRRNFQVSDLNDHQWEWRILLIDKWPGIKYIRGSPKWSGISFNAMCNEWVSQKSLRVRLLLLHIERNHVKLFQHLTRCLLGEVHILQGEKTMTVPGPAGGSSFPAISAKTTAFKS